MNSARSYLAELLRVLSVALPGSEPVMRYKRVELRDELCISFAAGVDIYLDDRDLGRPIDPLVAEVVTEYKRGLDALEIKRREREFDQRMGEAG